jgi:hypothetical protein
LTIGSAPAPTASATSVAVRVSDTAISFGDIPFSEGGKL